MPISSFCWLLSYWLLLSLKDTNNEALFLHLEAYCWSLRRIPIILWIPHKIGSKKKRNSILLFSHYSPVTIHLTLFTVTVHPLLFMTLFTPNFAYLRGVVPYVLGDLKSSLSSDFSSLRTSLLRERTHLTSTTTTLFTTLFTFVYYKPCNPTNLVTRTSSSFVTVNL